MTTKTTTPSEIQAKIESSHPAAEGDVALEAHFRRAATAIHAVLPAGAVAQLTRYTEKSFQCSDPARDGLTFEQHNREVDALAAILWQWGHPVVIKVVDD